jgi:hypothetical protein
MLTDIVYDTVSPVVQLGSPNQPTTIYVDNKSAIAMSKSDLINDRTKHIDIRYHHVRDLIKSRIIKIIWRSTSEMKADFLTKPLGRVAFHRAIADFFAQ